MYNLNKIYNVDCRTGLSMIPDETVDTCVTSPPYWGLRDYGNDAQIGLEQTPEQFIKELVDVFREVKRVLKNDGTLWVNIGDSYAAGPKTRTEEQACRKSTLMGSLTGNIACKDQQTKLVSGLKAKDLVGIPWMLAFALRTDGWYLRQDIIWSKKGCMPESVTDRCTKSHEYIFLLSKSPIYHYDHEAIKEVAIYDVSGTGTAARKARAKDTGKSVPTDKVNGIRKSGFKDASTFKGKHQNEDGTSPGKVIDFEQGVGMRNKRSVWTVSPSQFKDAHFATFPEDLIVDCIKAGCAEGGIILDPFMGAGTTALVSKKLNRNFIGFELNSDYIKIAEKRLKSNLGFFLKEEQPYTPKQLTII